MQTEVVKLDVSKPDAAKIKEAAALVDSGGLVAFPTETVYGIACRASTGSLTRLSELKGRDPAKPFTLHISSKGDVKRYVPTIGVRAQKLIEHAWPGPLTVVFELDARDVDKQRASFEAEVFKGLYRDNCIGIRCPDNSIAFMLLEEAQSPVVAPSANKTGRPPALDGEEVLAEFCGQIELVLDAGPCKYGKSSTIVKIGRRGLEVLRAGVYSRGDLEKMSQVQFLFVCTGNSCRSPMAEGMFRKYLAEKLECEVDELENTGYKTASAGVIDTGGVPASAEAIAACADRGVDIRAHRSRRLSEELVNESDFIFAMCQMHRDRITALSREPSSRCVLMAESEEVPDPIGQPQEVYESCAELIEKAVRKRVDELVL